MMRKGVVYKAYLFLVIFVAMLSHYAIPHGDSGHHHHDELHTNSSHHHDYSVETHAETEDHHCHSLNFEENHDLSLSCIFQDNHHHDIHVHEALVATVSKSQKSSLDNFSSIIQHESNLLLEVYDKLHKHIFEEKNENRQSLYLKSLKSRGPPMFV